MSDTKTFQGYTCWTQSAARHVLATEALQGRRSAFLATHVPIEGFELEGSEAALITQITEHGLLEAFAPTSGDEPPKHVFCVVEGNPGSGKSHLIRWLHASWPKNDADHVVMIRRQEGSLEGTLEQLRDQIPEEYRNHFQNLASNANLNDKGREQAFLDGLALALDPSLTDYNYGDHDFVQEHEPHHIFRQSYVAEHWSAPSRIRRIIQGHGSKSEQRDSERASFHLNDIKELANMGSKLQNGLPWQTKDLLFDIKDQMNLLPKDLAHLEFEVAREDAPLAVELLEALEGRANIAIQGLVGISAKGMDGMFRTLRRGLAEQGKRLVLLLEDITNFQGVDDRLLDAVLIDRSDTIDADMGGAPLCDLVSIVGVTPDYLKTKLRQRTNYWQRVTQHIKLDGQSSVLRQEGAPEKFAARYIRAIRAGEDGLEGASSPKDVPNVCTSCPHKVTCHKAFGHIDDVGLYPLSPNAVRSLYASLDDDRTGADMTTPRALIQNVLNPTFLNPQLLGQHLYPSAALETEYVKTSGRGPRGFLQSLLNEHPETERTVRLFTWWGNENEMLFYDHQHGSLNGIAHGIFEALGLPWNELRQSSKNIESQPEESPPQPSKDVQPPVTSSTQNKNTVSSSPAPNIQKSPSEKSSTSEKSSARSSSKSRLEDALRAWGNSDKLDLAEEWNTRLYDFVKSRPRWHIMQIDPWIQRVAFTKSLVVLEDTGRHSPRHFIVPRNSIVVEGLISEMEIEKGKTKTPSFHRYRIVRLVRWLEAHLINHIETVMSDEGALRLDPLALATQLSVARGWLRGTLKPKAPIVEHWHYILQKNEPDLPDRLDDRTVLWGTSAQKTSLMRVDRRDAIIEATFMAQGTTGAKDFANPGAVIGAIKRLRDNLIFDEQPESANIKLKAQFVQHGLDTALPAIDLHKVIKQESVRLYNSWMFFEESLGNISLESCILEIDGLGNQFKEIYPSLDVGSLQDWQKDYLSLEYLLDEEPLSRLNSFRQEWASREKDDLAPTLDLLALCVDTKASELVEIRKLINSGKRFVKALLTDADHLSEISTQDTSLKHIHDYSHKVETAITKIINAVNHRGET